MKKRGLGKGLDALIGPDLEEIEKQPHESNREGDASDNPVQDRIAFNIALLSKGEQPLSRIRGRLYGQYPIARGGNGLPHDVLGHGGL